MKARLYQDDINIGEVDVTGVQAPSPLQNDKSNGKDKTAVAKGKKPTPEFKLVGRGPVAILFNINAIHTISLTPNQHIGVNFHKKSIHANGSLMASGVIQ